MNEGKLAKWGDITTLEYGKSLRDYRNDGGTYRVYGTNGPIGWHSDLLSKSPGVIIGRKGAYRGVHYSPEPFFVIDTAFYLKPKPNVEVDLKWAYYELLTQDINGMDSGSAIPSTSRESFYGLPVRFPPIDEQKAIAKILSSLDDKIELNRRMNATLEAMARALFKAWFVDFEPVHANQQNRPSTSASPEIAKLFPSTFENGIPKGWKVRSIFDSAKFLNGLTFKTDKFSSGNEGMPVIKIAELKSGVSSQTKFTESSFDEVYRVSNGDILFSWSGSPETSIDIFIWIGTDGWLNQHIFKVVPLASHEQEYIYFLLREFKTEFIEIAKNKQLDLGTLPAGILKG